MSDERSLASTLLTWFFTAMLVIVAIKFAFWALGLALGLGGVLLAIAFRLLPLVLIGWLVVALVRYFQRKNG